MFLAHVQIPQQQSFERQVMTALSSILSAAGKT